MVVSLNYCSQNGGNLYRAPYYNGNPNIGPRIIGNLDQYPDGFKRVLNFEGAGAGFPGVGAENTNADEEHRNLLIPSPPSTPAPKRGGVFIVRGLSGA